MSGTFIKLIGRKKEGTATTPSLYKLHASVETDTNWIRYATKEIQHINNKISLTKGDNNMLNYQNG